MPKLGETVTEGTVGNWLKQVGDTVAFDDPLFEVSTDKVDSEIPSPYDGVLLEILVPAGETVPVGTPVARIGEPGAAPAAGGGAPAPAPAAAAAARLRRLRRRRRPPRRPTAAARRSRRSCAGSPRRTTWTWRGSRAAVWAGGSAARTSRRPSRAAAPRRPHPPRLAAPAAAAPATTQPRPAAPAAAAAAPKAGGDPRDQVQPLSRMRLALASGLKGSQMLAASVWTSIEIDYDNVDKVRAKHKDRFKKETGSSLSYLPFVSRAVVDALRAFPTVNSSIDVEAKTMTLHPYVNLGIAVDLNQQGLVVPVVKDADQLNMRGIAQGITKIAAAARSGKATMDDMRGSTFTITNPGPFASYASAPIINQPNVGILCTDGVKRRPVAVGDAIAIHPTGVLGLVYDHRAFDGSTASMFLMHIRDSLEKRDWEAEVG